MKIYVVLQERLSAVIDWCTIYSPKEFKLMLIASSNTYDNWYVTQREYFERIFVENSINYETVHKIMSTIISENQSDSIYIITNEEDSLLNCAKIRKSFGLEGDTEEVITIFRNKASMKARLIANGFAHLVPKFKIFDPTEVDADYARRLVDTLGFPVFCKPTTEALCRGTCILRSTEEISKWIQKNMDRSAGEFEFDEYITGEMYHCDSIVKNNQILHVQVSRYMCPCFEFTQGQPNGSIVLKCDDPMVKKIRDFNETIINGLQTVPNCVTHHELFVTEDDRLILVEIAARPPGMLVCPAYKLNIGLDLKLIHYKLQMGLDFDLVIQQGFYGAWVMFPKSSGKIVRLNEPIHLESTFYFEHEKEISTSSRRNVWLAESNILLWNKSFDVLLKDFNSLKHFIPAETAEN